MDTPRESTFKNRLYPFHVKLQCRGRKVRKLQNMLCQPPHVMYGLLSRKQMLPEQISFSPWTLPGTPRKAGQGGVAARRAGLGLEQRHPNHSPLALEEVGTAGGTFWGSQHLRAWLRTFRKLKDAGDAVWQCGPGHLKGGGREAAEPSLCAKHKSGTRDSQSPTDQPSTCTLSEIRT